MRVATNSVRTAAVRAMPAIAQISQAGKFAPAISTTGSQPAQSNAVSISAARANFARIHTGAYFEDVLTRQDGRVEVNYTLFHTVRKTPPTEGREDKRAVM